MDNIRQALERARDLKTQNPDSRILAPPIDGALAGNPPLAAKLPEQEIALNFTHLEANRIIAHNERDFRSRAFDMLRTQVLQSMNQANWRFLGVTSPTPGCGKTLVAANLALSIARQSERSAFLIDLDLQKPQVANCLGIDSEHGLIGVLEGRQTLSQNVLHTQAGVCRLLVLPAENSADDSSAWMTSRALSNVLQDVRRDYSTHTVIVDLPPMLASDDVIAVLPQLDCILLVAAVGKSKVSEIEECNRHLRSTEVVRLVLNKVPELETRYYGYYPQRRST